MRVCVWYLSSQQGVLELLARHLGGVGLAREAQVRDGLALPVQVGRLLQVGVQVGLGGQQVAVQHVEDDVHQGRTPGHTRVNHPKQR